MGPATIRRCQQILSSSQSQHNRSRVPTCSRTARIGYRVPPESRSAERTTHNHINHSTQTVDNSVRGRQLMELSATTVFSLPMPLLKTNPSEHSRLSCCQRHSDGISTPPLDGKENLSSAPVTPSVHDTINNPQKTVSVYNNDKENSLIGKEETLTRRAVKLTVLPAPRSHFPGPCNWIW